VNLLEIGIEIISNIRHVSTFNERVMLVDKKMFVSGIVMLAIGTIIMINLNATMPVGQSGMTDEEVIDLMTKQQEHKDMNTLSGILIGVGFMLILISFGARSRRKDSPKKEEKKPIS